MMVSWEWVGSENLAVHRTNTVDANEASSYLLVPLALKHFDLYATDLDIRGHFAHHLLYRTHVLVLRFFESGPRAPEKPTSGRCGIVPRFSGWNKLVPDIIRSHQITSCSRLGQIMNPVQFLQISRGVRPSLLPWQGDGSIVPRLFLVPCLSTINNGRFSTGSISPVKITSDTI